MACLPFDPLLPPSTSHMALHGKDATLKPISPTFFQAPVAPANPVPVWPLPFFQCYIVWCIAPLACLLRVHVGLVARKTHVQVALLPTFPCFTIFYTKYTSIAKGKLHAPETVTCKSLCTWPALILTPYRLLLVACRQQPFSQPIPFCQYGTRIVLAGQPS